MHRSYIQCDRECVKSRCLIVDDNERFLEVARSALGRDGIEVVGTATTAAEAVHMANELHPNVVLVDLSLGKESGFDVARQLVARFPDLRSGVVLISTRSEADYADLITASPAIGFLPKSGLSSAAIQGLWSAANGGGSRDSPDRAMRDH
jgi:DNA-binding NarL/FixJ family response regulator